ncbi:MAG: ferrochelatase [Burkholderiaceae bacterium]|nr:ferrochelatase [Burkholderiaceae bacterium]
MPLETMSFLPEPPASPETDPKIAVVLVNLGTPDAPTPAAVRRYLKQFLSDRRVIEVPRFFWWFALNGIILPFRAGKSARKYASIWTKGGSPLLLHTQKQAKLLRGYLGERGHDVQVVHAMRYGQPSLPSVLEQLKLDGCDRILILPAFPQYCSATTASIFDAVFAHCSRLRNTPELRLVKQYHDHECYIGALRDAVFAHWDANGRPDRLLMSFHGMPQKTRTQGDPYHDQCQTTAKLLAEQLGLSEHEWMMSFQSRFGRSQWLEPYTSAALERLAREGSSRVDVICPGFTADCLETLEEIAIEGRQTFLTAGGREFHYIPCLNDSNTWLHALAQIAEENLLGWPTMATKTSEPKGGLLRASAAHARV